MRKVLVAGVVALIAAACGLPFGLGLPSTSQLINGADDTIAKTSGFEITGSFTQASDKYSVDMQYQASGPAVHMDVTKGSTHVEQLQVSGKVYARGQDVVGSYTGSDDFGQAAAKLIGSNYFTTKSLQRIDLSEITNADKVKANFLTSATYSRKDHEQVNGQDTAELSDSESILNITESSPFQLVRIRTKPGSSLSGTSDVDFTLRNYGKNFNLVTPAVTFDLDTFDGFPPFYSVAGSININGCNADPCVISAVLVNKGGVTTASAPPTITFTLTNKADNSALGSCQVTIAPNVAHGASTAKGCSITSAAWHTFAGTYLYDAAVTNPAYS
jgi:hypothetical protein